MPPDFIKIDLALTDSDLFTSLDRSESQWRFKTLIGTYVDIRPLVRERLHLPPGFEPKALSCVHCPGSDLALDTPVHRITKRVYHPYANNSIAVDEEATREAHRKLFTDWFEQHAHCEERAERERLRASGWRD